MKVLIIDDYPGVRKMCTIALEKMGHTVSSVWLWDDIDVAIKEKPDAIILDYDLCSAFTGLAVLERYYLANKNIKWYANSTSDEHNQLLLSAGCIDVIGINAIKKLSELFGR